MLRVNGLILICALIMVLLLSSCASPTIPTNPSQPNITVDQFLKIFGDTKNWEHYRLEEPIAIKGETTFASGLIRDVLSTVYTNSEYVFVSGPEGGYGYFKWEDLPDLRGKIKNFLIKATGNFVSGNVQWAEDLEGNIYALYWDKILDALEGEILFDSSKRNDGFGFTTSFYGCSPNQRFVIDNDGNFWVGTSEVREDRYNYDESKYGLFKISKNLTNWECKNLLPGYDVWRIYKDSSGTIWISALNGVYYYDTVEDTLVKVFGDDREGKTPKQIYDEELSGDYLFCEDMVEFDGKIYFLMKNFFARGAQQSQKKYYLYSYSDSEQKLVPYEGYQSSLPNFEQTSQARIFEYKGELYILCGNDGGVFDLAQKKYVDPSEVTWMKGKRLGTWLSTCEVDGKEVLATVAEDGGIIGVRIFGFYEEPFDLTQATTCQGLVSNFVENIFYDEQTENTYLSHSITYGYTVLQKDKNNFTFKPYYFPEFVLNFFKYNNELYLVSNDVYKWDESKQDFTHFADFRTNMEKVRLHNKYLWSIETGGAVDNSYLYCLNLDTKELRTNNQNWLDLNNKYIKISGISGYQIFDLIGVDDDTVFIAVGSEIDYKKKFPYIYKYSYSTNSLEQVNIPNENEIRIRAFAKADDDTIYAIGSQTVYKYENGEWQTVMTLNTLDLQDAKAIIRGKWMFVVSKWSGIYAIHVESGKYEFYEDQNLNLAGVRTIEFGKENGKAIIWVGSANGLGKFKFGELVPNEND